MAIAHPSSQLQDAFARKPYQGAHPTEARFLFVGLDANYAPDIEKSPVFKDVLRYHHDGPAFWRQEGVHHPFLMRGYKGGGKRYHRGFARIGFQPEHASLVSFVELLHFPTTGEVPLQSCDVGQEHVAFINRAAFDGNARHVFISSTVLGHLRKIDPRNWGRATRESDEVLPILYRDNERAIHQHLHFSFQFGQHSKLLAEANAIRTLLLNDV